MALEPLYFAALIALATLSTAWVIAAFIWKPIGWAWKLMPAIIGWWLVWQENAIPHVLAFTRSDLPLVVKFAYVCAALLIVFDMYVIYVFVLGRGRTTRRMRLFMMTLFALSHGGVIWLMHATAGEVCSPFTVYAQICTSYASLGAVFLPVPVVGYILMAIVTNPENTYSVLSLLGHRVDVSREGVDADPEPSMTVAMVLETLDLKTLFERVRHFVKKSYNVQAEALQKAQGGVQMLVYFGGNFEIADFLRFDEVGEEFALAAAKDDLTEVVRKSAATRTPERVLELRLREEFADNFNRDSNPVQRYGLRMSSATPLRADYYNARTREFFDELATLREQVAHVEEFTTMARAAYDRLPRAERSKFTFSEYLAMFMAMSGKGATFGQYGFRAG